jgi:uncharacterized protein involved in exopolysaccharide biosynthesis
MCNSVAREPRAAFARWIALMNISEATWSRREIARVFFRYQRRGAIVFGSCMLLVVIGLVLCTRMYTSEARLFVRLGRESVALDPTATTGAVVSYNNSREAEINSVLEVLRSRSNVERVFDATVPDAATLSPIERERALTGLTRELSIHAPQLTNIIVLTCKAESPELAQKRLTLLLEVCLKEHLRVNRTPGSYEFFDEQAQLLKSKLDEASRALRDAKNRSGLVTLEGRRVALEQQLGTVKSQLRESEAALAASEARTHHLEESMDVLPESLVARHIGGSPNDALSSMRQKLYELQNTEQELRAKFSELHPKVVAIRQQVQQMQRILTAEIPKHGEAVTAVIATELANAASLRARIQSLGQQQVDLDKELQELNQQDVLVTQLERGVRLLDANYVNYVTGLEQARIDQALKTEGISNINVVQSPTFSPKASEPKKALTLAIGMAVSLIGAVGTMLLSSHLDQSLKTIDEIELTLGVPVLASIPRVEFDMEKFSPQPTKQGRLKYVHADV